MLPRTGPQELRGWTAVRFRSPMKAQSSVLALNVVSGFFLALTVPWRAASWVDWLSYRVQPVVQQKRPPMVARNVLAATQLESNRGLSW